MARYKDSRRNYCVNRRIGGLEITPRNSVYPPCVNRRIGGLESPVALKVKYNFVNRRIGGLEKIGSS